MKASSIVLSIFIAIALFGCKSNPIVPTSLNPFITVFPDSLQGAEYVDYTFKAKITNYDLAQVYFLWNMGDGSQVIRESPSYQKIHSYSKPGVFKITVDAHDIYSDSIIASKSITVSIDTVKTTMEIIPQFYNGFLKMDQFGNLQESFSLSVKISNPNISLRYIWDFGDGTKDSSGIFNGLHSFRLPGKYIVRVDAYQQNGIYEGTDTAAISINFADISSASIQAMSRVQAFLYVDKSYTLSSAPWFYSPMLMGLPFASGNGFSSSNSGTSFLTHFHSENGIGTKNYERQDAFISGSLSSDAKIVTSITISSEDTTSVGTANTMIQYGFSEANAKLYAVTADQVFYKVEGADLRNNLQNSNYFNYWKDSIYCPTGDPRNGIHIVNGQPITPQCIIIFSKQ